MSITIIILKKSSETKTEVLFQFVDYLFSLTFRQRLFDHLACLVLYQHCLEVKHLALMFFIVILLLITDMVQHDSLSVKHLVIDIVVWVQLHVTTQGKFCVYIPLSPSSIIWYWHKLESKQQVLWCAGPGIHSLPVQRPNERYEHLSYIPLWIWELYFT